jgi:hypothetical protein
MTSSLFYLAWSFLPEDFRNPWDIRRRCQSWKDLGTIFIHVPKTAGVSVSRALYGRPLGHFTAVDIRRVLPREFGSLFTFGVVRNPLNRLISAYRFARAGGTSEMRMKKPGIYSTEEFRTFDSFVFEWLVHQDLSSVDGVFRPQYLYLCDKSGIIVDYVATIENLCNDIDVVSLAVNRVIHIEHNNQSCSENLIEPSIETIQLVQHLYEKDYVTFGYPFQ